MVPVQFSACTCNRRMFHLHKNLITAGCSGINGHHTVLVRGVTLQRRPCSTPCRHQGASPPRSNHLPLNDARRPRGRTSRTRKHASTAYCRIARCFGINSRSRIRRRWLHRKLNGKARPQFCFQHDYYAHGMCVATPLFAAHRMYA